jgi:hypothetical protein
VRGSQEKTEEQVSYTIARIDIFSRNDNEKIGEMNLFDNGIIEGYLFEQAAKNIEEAVQAASGTDHEIACSIFIKLLRQENLMAVNYTTTYTTYGEELADVDVSQLTRREAHDLRLELTEQLVEIPEQFTEETRTFYKKKIEELKAFLGSD